MEILFLVIPLAVGVLGTAVRVMVYIQSPKQQGLPAPAPAPQPKPTIESYHTLAEIWDYTLAGSGAPKPSGDAQYAGMQAEAPRPPAGPSRVSRPSRDSQYAPETPTLKKPEPPRQSPGHLGLDYGLTTSRMTAATLSASRITIGKLDNTAGKPDRTSYSNRTLRCDAYVRTSPYRKSEYVQISKMGTSERVIGYVYGEEYSVSGKSSNVWFVLEDNLVIWSGFFTNSSILGLHPYGTGKPEAHVKPDTYPPVYIQLDNNTTKG